jgi:AraC family transcriptional regulator of adaptative response / DNA-3-methyladenine glycosylase II
MSRSDGWSEQRRLVEDLAGRLRRDAGAFRDAGAMAAACGVGAAELAGLCRRHHHATPAEMLDRARVERCRRELLDGGRPLAEIAAAAGFASPERFDTSFRRLCRMAPADYRRLRGASRFEIRLPRWFQRRRVLAYLGRDPESLTEQVEGDAVRFGLWAAGRPAAVTVALRGSAARCELAAPRLGEGAAADVHGQLLRLLGLVIDPRPFERRRTRQPLLARLVAGRLGLSIPQTASLFDGLVWVVCGQQVSLPVAFAMRRRLAGKAGTRVDGAGGRGLWAPPPADAVAALAPDDFRALGFSRAKADYLGGIAAAVAGGSLSPERLAENSASGVESELGAVRGLGPWSVNYLRMRCFGFVDCVPAGDVALERNLERFFGLERRPRAAETLALMEVFAPHRSLATFHLWALQEESQ